MLVLEIVAIALLGVILALFLYSSWKNQGVRESEASWTVPVADLEARMESLETRWVTMRDDLQERFERGTEQWRKVRQADAQRRRRQELADSEEEEEGREVQELLPLDDGGSDPRGMSYVSAGVGSDSQAPWQEFRRALAQQIAGGN